MGLKASMRKGPTINNLIIATGCQVQTADKHGILQDGFENLNGIAKLFM